MMPKSAIERRALKCAVIGVVCWLAWPVPPARAETVGGTTVPQDDLPRLVLSKLFPNGSLDAAVKQAAAQALIEEVRVLPSDVLIVRQYLDSATVVPV